MSWSIFHRDAKERLAEISTEKRSQLHKQETERYGSGLSGRKVWGQESKSLTGGRATGRVCAHEAPQEANHKLILKTLVKISNKVYFFYKINLNTNLLMPPLYC